LGNASALPFESATFDYVLCRAAFKNFTEPVRALQEMCRVLRPGGRALVFDLRKDASPGDIARAVDAMGLSFPNGMITKLTFRFMLLKRAYTRQEIERFLAEVECESKEVREDLIGLEIHLRK
jgi:ubiquinone/menaquinone biosynthesis C-methylase UbiE